MNLKFSELKNMKIYKFESLGIHMKDLCCMI